MDIGLNIADGVRVSIGDKIEDITDTMNKHKVEYTIPYKTRNNNNVEMIMFMEKCGVELNIKNGSITYIKSNNSNSNYIMQLDSEMTAVEALEHIKKTLSSEFKVDESSIRIDRFDGKTMNSMLSIPFKGDLKVKVELIKGAHEKIFMHSIQLSK